MIPNAKFAKFLAEGSLSSLDLLSPLSLAIPVLYASAFGPTLFAVILFGEPAEELATTYDASLQNFLVSLGQDVSPELQGLCRKHLSYYWVTSIKLNLVER